jgi:hypothetical protein
VKLFHYFIGRGSKIHPSRLTKINPLPVATSAHCSSWAGTYFIAERFGSSRLLLSLIWVRSVGSDRPGRKNLAWVRLLVTQFHSLRQRILTSPIALYQAEQCHPDDAEVKSQGGVADVPDDQRILLGR